MMRADIRCRLSSSSRSFSAIPSAHCRHLGKAVPALHRAFSLASTEGADPSLTTPGLLNSFCIEVRPDARSFFDGLHEISVNKHTAAYSAGMVRAITTVPSLSADPFDGRVPG